MKFQIIDKPYGKGTAKSNQYTEFTLAVIETLQEMNTNQCFFIPHTDIYTNNNKLSSRVSSIIIEHIYGKRMYSLRRYKTLGIVQDNIETGIEVYRVK